MLEILVILGVLSLVVAIYLFKPVYGSFEATHFIWSRGLALLCDHNGGKLFIKNQRGNRPAIRFNPEEYSNIRPGDLVWVRHTALSQFVSEVLPDIRNRFVLVTGDEDMGIPSGFDKSLVLLKNPYLIHWFTQNNDGTDQSGKVSGIPIGLDFHTLSNGRKWKHWPATPASQEKQLKSVICNMTPTDQRFIQVHADFHLNQNKKKIWSEGRPEIERKLRSNPLVFFQNKKMRRLDQWIEKTRFAFTISPHGNGLDCHRTWESLLLGNICIVLKSSLDPLYEALPVVILNNWEEINEENLHHWLDEYANAFDCPKVQKRLTNTYWLEKMRKFSKKSI